MVSQIDPYAPEGGRRGKQSFPVQTLLRIHFMQQWLKLSSTKNQSDERDPEMPQSKKGNQWYLGMKPYIAVDADSGLMRSVRGTSGNVNDVVEANWLLHGQDTDAFGDAGYQGADRRPNANKNVRWYVAMRPRLRRALDKGNPVGLIIDQLERTYSALNNSVFSNRGVGGHWLRRAVPR